MKHEEVCFRARVEQERQRESDSSFFVRGSVVFRYLVPGIPYPGKHLMSAVEMASARQQRWSLDSAGTRQSEIPALQWQLALLPPHTINYTTLVNPTLCQAIPQTLLVVELYPVRLLPGYPTGSTRTCHYPFGNG